MGEWKEGTESFLQLLCCPHLHSLRLPVCYYRESIQAALASSLSSTAVFCQNFTLYSLSSIPLGHSSPTMRANKTSCSWSFYRYWSSAFVCVCVSNSPANVLNILIGVYSALSFILHLSPENQLPNQCKRKLLTEYCHSHTSFSSILDRIASATLLRLKSNHTISLTKTYLALQHPEWSSAVAAVAMIFLM